ncbi:MAG: zinc metallopeptidase [Bacteroidales bacterium]|nr:zinc metallopeptidase [Bacteroidales bacterium]MBR6162181.1 zinc metallopeptidase [Bacteroidales bacterium]
MNLEGRRESTNVDDRRGKRVVAGAGMGIGGIIIAGIIALMLGKNPVEVIQNMGATQQQTTETNYQPTAEEEELATFAKKILAGTEDVWTAEFKKLGREYVPPKLVLFSGSVQSGCGGATSSTGPFYCSADQTVYIDLSFFSSMKKQFGTAGDFAYAYVIAHEVGHHVQYLLGTLNQAHQQMSRVSKTQSNQISVRLELQADFYAGVWANKDNEMFNSLEEGDVDEGLAIAARIGDDYLQKQAQGYAVPESFNHGTSAQRSKWLKKGITTGDVRQGDTFSPDYNQL